MSVTITSVGLLAAYPEWANAPTDVLANVIAVANAKSLPLYTNSAEETDRRYLEACANLYTMPFARDMHKPDQEARNPYREEARRRDQLKGATYRVPGWTIPVGVP